uniref:Uncharacterized protein n=1 Tax=Oryza glumipatula TaxID=40148 RepID=A0A0E0AFM1_9ORYZ
METTGNQQRTYGGNVKRGPWCLALASDLGSQSLTAWREVMDLQQLRRERSATERERWCEEGWKRKGRRHRGRNFENKPEF